MGHTYAQRKIADGTPGQMAAAQEHPLSAQHLDALRRGAAAPSPADMGQRIDLPEAMRAKMERAFGADFSAVKLYSSQAVADAGAQAVARGSSIAFAPDKADFSTRRGQALLGHELSHVMGQARGEVRGSGFLHNAALEARADREGAMAAGGEQVYTGPVTAAMSAAAPSLSMAGPMQASKETDAENTAQDLVAGRQLKERLDTGNTQATEQQAVQMVLYQQKLADLNYYRKNKDSRNPFRPLFSRSYHRGKRVQRHLDAIRDQAGVDAASLQIPQKDRNKADARMRAVTGVEADAGLYTPLAPHYEALRRSRNKDLRKRAYYGISDTLAARTSQSEQEVITDYIETSEPFNSVLRNDVHSSRYPKTQKERREMEKKNAVLSSVLDRNRLEQDVTTYRGVGDRFLRKLLAAQDFQEALNPNGTVNHDWIKAHMDEFNQRMTGRTFTDPGFMSTSTQKEFAEYWSTAPIKHQQRNELEDLRQQGRIRPRRYNRLMREIKATEAYPGTHVMELALPRGAPVAAIDRAGMINRGPSGQYEMLIDKGGTYEFTGIAPGKVDGSYAMKLRLLSEEEARRRNQAGNAGQPGQ